MGEHITDISTDFSDGIKLTYFLELLSGKKQPKRPEEPKSRIHKINNVFLALQFLETMDVKVEGVAAEGTFFFPLPLIYFLYFFLLPYLCLDFVDSNKKLILGFLWTLYRKYRINVIKEGGTGAHRKL
jgi:cortexillin 1/2